MSESAFLTCSISDLQAASKVPLVVLPTAEEVLLHFARAVADEIKTHNHAGLPTRLILPVGPVGQYPLLAEICNTEDISWKNVHTFNMDEYCDWQGRAIPSDHPLSFRGYMQREFFDRLNPDLCIPASQIHFPDPLNLDDISRQIAAVGEIDTCYGGLGVHGHVAFNEPPISRWYTISPAEFRQSKTRLLPLAPETVTMNSTRSAGGDMQALPPMAVTLGMADLYAAKRVRLYCPGGMWQRTALRMACCGPVDVRYPVTLFQDHPDFQLIASAETAAPAISAL